MYLKRLELQGFKSFSDRTILEFKPGITAVIGPNGSGKSNISDAIRWVLGEQSMKSLRGTKSEDIIFAGTQNRKSLGFAEASIVIDNSDGKLPIEYREVIVTRKIYRSGETGYFINKVQCRLKDVLELFMDTGIGKDGYSIIGQGRIDEILSNKSEDRRHIFEEAAGIVKYRTRKEESEKKLEQTKLNLLRINDVITEIEAQLDPLKKQSEVAKEYLELKEELKSIEVGLFCHNISENKAKLDAMTKDYDIIKEQVSGEDGKLNTINYKKETLKAHLEEVNNLLENTQNIGFESKARIEQINSDINVTEERNVHANEDIERLKNEITELEAKITEYEDEKSNKSLRKEDLKKNKEKYENELQEKEEELKKLTQKLSSKELEIEDKKKSVESNVDKRYELQNEISNIDITIENLEKRERQIRDERVSQVSELDSTRLDKEQIIKSFTEIENKKNKALRELNDIKEQKEKATARIEEYDNQIETLEYEYRMKDSRCKFLKDTEKEKEGYSQSVKSLLLAVENKIDLKSGVNGVLANLLKVDSKYQTAIEMALGNALQNIVTEKEEDAKRLIEYLRENNLGRASFLPIAAVKGQSIDRIDQKGLDGVIGVASDLVKYDKKYQGVVSNLLGRTVVVDNMKTAIELAKRNKYSFKIVTIEGDIVNPSGSMTGGSVLKKTVNILGRSSEIEELQKELVKLKANIDSLIKERDNYKVSVTDIMQKSTELERNLQNVEIEYATEKARHDNMDNNISKIEERIKKLDIEKEEIAKQKIELVASKEGIKDSIENLNGDINKLTEEVKEFASLNKEDQEYIDNLNLDITDLKISVSSFDESGSSIDELVERINQDIENSKNQIESKKTSIINEEKEIEENTKKIEELKQTIEKIKSDVDNSSLKIEELKQDRDKTNKEISDIEYEIEHEYGTINDLKEQLVKMETKKQKLEEELESLINRLWDEYEITPNTAGEYEKPSNIAEASKTVAKIRNKIRDLGIVNVNAIEEYKKLSERYDFMTEQRLDLEESIAKLNKIIDDMISTMKTQFSKKFKQINKYFNEIFAELFGGGKAELSLENEENILECGIEIKAQPPGKALKNMMLLSGGEKALTAIAILFAILKINPAPFCILDEIEAALDDVNVNRYAEFLRKFSKETQFLVITHRKGTMEIADSVYGVTMEEKGISKLLSMSLANKRKD